MNPTKLTYGTLKLTYGQNSLTLDIALPRFLAEQVNGDSTPEEWDGPLGEWLLRDKADAVDWTGRLNFPSCDELTEEGSGWGTGAGWPVEDRGLGKGAKKPAVRRQPGGRVGGRGLRKLPLSRRGQKVPAGAARKVDGAGKKGRASRKNTVSLVSSQWR